MKRGHLPPKWVQWQRYRYQGLMASGLASPLAHKLATWETRVRHRASKVVGFKAACDAELIPTNKGVSIEGGIAGLTDDQINRLGGLVVKVEGAAA